jgi:polysaccharide biosynthesis protein PslH
VRLLLVTIDFPLPVDAGGVVRLLGLAEALSRRHEVHLLARERRPTSLAVVEALSERLGGAPVETFPAPEPVPDGRASKLARWSRAVARRKPPWVLRADSPALRRRAAELAPDFDAAIVLDDNASVYVDALHTRVPVVLDKQNVKAYSFRQEPSGWGPSLRGRAMQRLAGTLYVGFERRSSRRAELVVVTSNDEARRFELAHGWRPAVVPSAIPKPRAVADVPSAPAAVAWLGDHTYAANVDGLLRFVREGWAPLGRSGARLLVTGRRPPAEVMELAAASPGVEVLGYVEDLEALLVRCAAAVVPLWRGVGIKMKTLTLMGAGLPVVSTPVGLEGIGARDGEHARVAPDPQGLGAALHELLADRHTGAAVGRRGHELIVAEHSWDRLVPRYERLVAEVAGR